MRQRKIQRIRAHTHLDHTVDATVRLFDTMVAGKGEAADLAGYAIARAALLRRNGYTERTFARAIYGRLDRFRRTGY
jgi:hypothetical protein